MLLFCQACGAAQVVDGEVDPCWRCDGTELHTLHPMDREPTWRPTVPIEPAPPLRHTPPDNRR